MAADANATAEPNCYLPGGGGGGGGSVQTAAAANRKKKKRCLSVCWCRVVSMADDDYTNETEDARPLRNSHGRRTTTQDPFTIRCQLISKDTQAHCTALPCTAQFSNRRRVAHSQSMILDGWKERRKGEEDPIRKRQSECECVLTRRREASD